LLPSPALACFDYNKPSGCQRRSCHFPHICTTATQATASSSTALVPNSPEATTDQRSPVIAARNKVEQCQLDCSLIVSTPLNIDKFELELVNHPNCCFIDALRYGTYISYLGPHKTLVSRNLISAFHHPNVVSRNKCDHGLAPYANPAQRLELFGHILGILERE